jgi:hypothetical protein
MIHLFHHWRENRRLKRELAEFTRQFEANLRARKQARLSGQTYVGPHLRRRAG